MAAARARGATLDPDARPGSRSDVYTGMLVISLLAMIVGCILLYLDYSNYATAKPPQLPPNPSVSVPAAPQPQGGAGTQQPQGATPRPPGRT